MTAVHYHAQRLGDIVQALDVRLRRQMKDERQVRLKGAQRIQRPVVIAHLHLKLHQRMLLPKAGDTFRQVAARGGLTDDDPHAAAAQPLQVLDLGAHLLQMRSPAADVMHKQLAGRRQPHAPRQTLEQWCTQFVFQVLNTAIHRRRRDVQTLGSLADRAHSGHLIQIVQKAQMIHISSCHADQHAPVEHRSGAATCPRAVQRRRARRSHRPATDVAAREPGGQSTHPCTQAICRGPDGILAPAYPLPYRQRNAREKATFDSH